MLAPVLFLLSFSTLLIIKQVILTKVQKYLKKQEKDVENIRRLIREFRKSLSTFFMVIMSLYLATFHLQLAAWMELSTKVILFIFITVYSYRLILFFTHLIIDRNSELRENKNAVSLINLSVKTLTITILILWLMSNIGIDINAFIAGLGIASITLVFAVQNIIADIFASFTIYLDRPFEIDDFIEVNGESGTIEKIGVRSTHLRSVDGHLIILSNQALTRASIANFKKMEARRVKQTIGVSANTPISLLRKIPDFIQEAIDDLPTATTRKVYLNELGDYTWNYVIIYFINSGDVDIYWDTKEEINFRILELMEEHDITLPYPIQEVQLTTNGAIQEVPLPINGA